MFSGVIKKMISINGDPIRYMLDFENDLLFLNQFIGKNINLKKKGYLNSLMLGQVQTKFLSP